MGLRFARRMINKNIDKFIMNFKFAGSQKWDKDYNSYFIYKGVDLLKYQYKWKKIKNEYIQLEMKIPDVMEEVSRFFVPTYMNMNLKLKIKNLYLHLGRSLMGFGASLCQKIASTFIQITIIKKWSYQDYENIGIVNKGYRLSDHKVLLYEKYADNFNCPKHILDKACKWYKESGYTFMDD